MWPYRRSDDLEEGYPAARWSQNKALRPVQGPDRVRAILVHGTLHPHCVLLVRYHTGSQHLGQSRKVYYGAAFYDLPVHLGSCLREVLAHA